MAVEQTERFGLFQWTQQSDNFTRLQMVDSHEQIEALLARFEEGATLPTLPDSSYARAFFHDTTTDDLYFSSDGTSWQSVVHDLDPVELATVQTLTNKTFTSPVISQINNGGTLTLPTATTTLIGKQTTETLENKTFQGADFEQPKLIGNLEKWNIVASAPLGSLNIDVQSSAAWYYTSNATTNVSLNFRTSSSIPLSESLAQSETITVVFAMTNGSSAYYVTTILVDGVVQGAKWVDGSAPTSGTTNSVDVYTVTIHRKTGVTPSYTVFAQVNQFG